MPCAARPGDLGSLPELDWTPAMCSRPTLACLQKAWNQYTGNLVRTLFRMLAHTVRVTCLAQTKSSRCPHCCLSTAPIFGPRLYSLLHGISYCVTMSQSIQASQQERVDYSGGFNTSSILAPSVDALMPQDIDFLQPRLIWVASILLFVALGRSLALKKSRYPPGVKPLPRQPGKISTYMYQE